MRTTEEIQGQRINTLFVYGTLLPGLRLHHAMQGARSIGCGAISGLLYDLGSYPGVVHGAGKVWGEVYEVDSQKLTQLDAIEAFYPDEPEDKSEYIRELADVHMIESGPVVTAWFYRFNRSVTDKRLIDHGDYLFFSCGKRLNNIAPGPNS